MTLEGFTNYKKTDADKYNRLRWWLGVTFGDVFNKATDLYPKREALVDDTCRLTYSELRKKVDNLAISLIRIGINKGDCVLLQLPNWREFVLSFFALHKIGAIVALLLPRHAQIEICHIAQLSKAKAWIVPEQHRKTYYVPIIDDVLGKCPELRHVILVRSKKGTQFTRLETLTDDIDLDPKDTSVLDSRRPDPNEVALLLPTGGTTGLLKLAPRTHNSHICNAEYYSKPWELNINDVCLSVTPVGHNAPLLNGIIGPILNFSKIVLLDSTKADRFCEIVQEEGVTCVSLVPALARRLLKFKGLGTYDLSSLAKVSIGGAHSPPDLIKNFHEKTGCICVNSFGMVEGPCARTRLDDDLEIICNTVGTPACPYDEFKVVDEEERELPPNEEGELVARGPGVFTGYLKSDNSECFTNDGYFRTGDLAVIDELGNIRITGRIKDIIIRGGENIGAGEIEDLIGRHPDVDDVAVIGMSDEELGERVCAYIQLVPGAALSPEDLISFLVSQGASKLLLPERIEFVETIPLTKVGKPDKKALREDIRSLLEARL